ncbi:MAG: tetraacyldisaccharide 4'-kinase [Acidobacteria bacterium]|nr:tetraacyldisaccharide 4'-kinase [Acidobacteriota bacterium]
MRSQLYRYGFFAQKRLRTKVLSTGNITWGGTGKTPFVIWLAGKFQAAGVRVSILTRGYRRRSSQPVQILAPGTDAEQAQDAGDEVQLYLRHLQVPVGVAASRYEAGRLLEKQFPVDVHLLDDGFQHLALARDLDLVLIDASNPWGARDGWPRLLRESPSALQRAQGILLTRCELVAEEPLKALRTTLRKFNPDAALFTARTQLLGFREPAPSTTDVSIGDLRARRPAAFCDVGNPGNFFLMLEQAGIAVVANTTFPDHHRYSAQDIARLEKLACGSGADCLLTTEKDLVNLPPNAPLSLPLFWAVPEVHVEEEDSLLRWLWERLGWTGRPLPATATSAQDPASQCAHQTVRSP